MPRSLHVPIVALLASAALATPSSAALQRATSAQEQRALDPCEDLAQEAEAAIGAALITPILRLDLASLAAQLGAGFAARFPRPEEGVELEHAAPGLLIEQFRADDLSELDAERFVAALAAHVEGWEALESARFSFTDFEPVADASAARARARLALGARCAGGARAELHAELELALACTPEPRRWTLTRLDWLDGHRVASDGPRFADVSGPTGFALNLSSDSQRLLRELVDDRALWNIGGLSALDWNRDGLPDLLAARRDQLAVLFVNDGDGGFRREALPLASPRALGGTFLFVDLDGDGLEELVPGALGAQRGELAWLAIHTRRDGVWQELPRALELRLAERARDPLVQAIVPADVDGDGQLDLFVGVHADARSGGGLVAPLGAVDGGPDRLFMNRGGLAFVEEGVERGIAGREYTTAAAFLDADLDGDQDLFVASAWGRDRLLSNDGAGRFEHSLDTPFTARTSVAGGLATCSIDGAPAIFVSNPYSPTGARIARSRGNPADDELRAQALALATGSRLFVLDEPRGTWRERAVELGLADAGWGFAPLFVDFENDGDRDLFVSNGVATHQDPTLPDFERLLWRQVAADERALRGELPRVLAEPDALLRFRGSFAGWQRERAFVRAGGPTERFFEAGQALGLDVLQDGRSCVALDFDGDGDQDLASFDLFGLRLFENRGASGNFARIELVAPPAAWIGARIELEADGARQRRRVELTSGHASQVLAVQHFGLGAAERIARVEVHWADGARDAWEDLPAGKLVRLSRGGDPAQIRELERWPRALPAWPRPDMSRRLPRLTDGEGTLASRGRPALIVCWTPEHEVRHELLATLAQLEREHAGRLRTASVCVDAPEGEVARALAQERAPGLAHFRSTPAFLASWFADPRAPELPCAFVFDASGELRRIVSGRNDPEALREVVGALLDEDIFVAELVRKATWLLSQGESDAARECLRLALLGDPRAASAHEALGRLYAQTDEHERAADAFRTALELDPGAPRAQHNLGVALVTLGKLDEAIVAFEAAVKERDGDSAAWLALGSAYLAQERSAESLAAFERARALAPDDPVMLFSCARALGKLGRREEARAHLERALELAPDFEAARALLTSWNE